MMLILILVIGYIAYLFIKDHQNRNPITNQNSNSAMDILKTKYVSGEISEEEYLRRKKVLES